MLTSSHLHVFKSEDPHILKSSDSQIPFQIPFAPFIRPMNILVGVISPAAAWVIPRSFVERIRRDFPQHTIVDTWDFGGIQRLLPAADAAFVPHVTREMLASAPRLRWVQSPAVGVGNMLF